MEVEIIEGDNARQLAVKVNSFIGKKEVVNISYTVEARPKGAYHYALVLYK